MELRSHIETLELACAKLEYSEDGINEIKKCLPIINADIGWMLELAKNVNNDFEINEQFVFQVLKDIIYGIENKDGVYLLDAVRYGLLQIYYYADEEMGES